MSELIAYQISIEEVQENLTRQYETIGALRAIARTFLTAASLIFAFIGIFQLTLAPSQGPFVIVHNIILVLILVLYVLLVGTCTAVISPAEMKGPIDPTWPEIYKAFLNKAEEELLRTRLAAYLNAISLNDELLDKRNKLTKRASRLLPTIAVLLLGLSVVSRLAARTPVSAAFREPFRNRIGASMDFLPGCCGTIDWGKVWEIIFAAAFAVALSTVVGLLINYIFRVRRYKRHERILLELAVLRDEGVAIRNKGMKEELKDDALRSWSADVKEWEGRLYKKAGEFSSVEEVRLKTVDWIPLLKPEQIRDLEGKDIGQAQLDILSETSETLKRLDRMLEQRFRPTLSP